MNDYKKLVVWTKAYALVRAVHAVLRKMPKIEEYGLTSQLRRAAVSIPSNIAEGARRNSKKDFAHFLHIASGSCAELETQLMLARDEYLSKEADAIENILRNLDEVQKMLYALAKRLS